MENVTTQEWEEEAVIAGIISLVKFGHRSLLVVRSCLALPTFVTALPASLGHFPS